MSAFRSHSQCPKERIGEKLKNSLLRKIILTDKTAKGMAEHCCVEYRNFAEILSDLYKSENI